MKKINIAEFLKDCPRGMELDCSMFDNVYLERVEKNIKNIEYPIVIRIGKTDIVRLTKEGCWNKYSSAKCVIFPKGKTTWEGFVPPCQFKDGDIIYNQGIKATAIFCKQISNNTISHCFLNVCREFRICHYHSKFLHDWRLATEEEKAKLFQAIKDNGYYWNEETKTLEKLKFKVGDKIKHKCDKNNTIITITGLKHNYYYIQYYNIVTNGYNNEKLSFIDQDKFELVYV